MAPSRADAETAASVKAGLDTNEHEVHLWQNRVQYT